MGYVYTPTAEYHRLWSTWADARGELTRSDSDYNTNREQSTFDALIDYIEAHNLNHTVWDPRGVPA